MILNQFANYNASKCDAKFTQKITTPALLKIFKKSVNFEFWFVCSQLIVGLFPYPALCVCVCVS